MQSLKHHEGDGGGGNGGNGGVQGGGAVGGGVAGGGEMGGGAAGGGGGLEAAMLDEETQLQMALAASMAAP